jgi:hypothetical protein
MKADWLQKKKKTPSVTNDDIHNKLDHMIVGESKPSVLHNLGNKRNVRKMLAAASAVLVLGGLIGIYIIQHKPEPPPPQPVQQAPPEELKWSKIFEYKVE